MMFNLRNKSYKSSVIYRFLALFAAFCCNCEQRISMRVTLFSTRASPPIFLVAPMRTRATRARARARRNAIHAAIHARRIIAFAKYCPRTVRFVDDTQPCLRLRAPSTLPPPAPHIPSSSSSAAAAVTRPRLRRCWFLLLSTTQQPPTVAQRLLLADYLPGRSRNRSDRSLARSNFVFGCIASEPK